MSHLDYVSCILTIVATFLVGRKSWMGLLLSIINSLIVCVIAFRTGQFGFIPANLFCICVYSFSIRSWTARPQMHRTETPSVVEVGTIAMTMVRAPRTPPAHDIDSTQIRSEPIVAAQTTL